MLITLMYFNISKSRNKRIEVYIDKCGSYVTLTNMVRENVIVYKCIIDINFDRMTFEVLTLSFTLFKGHTYSLYIVLNTCFIKI